MKKRKTKKKTAILSGHVQVGKRFIPPMKRLPKLQEVSYVDDILPELIWIGLIYDNVGYSPTARYIEKLIAAAMSIDQDGDLPPGNFSLVSQFGRFTDTQKAAFLCALEERSLLADIRGWLEPLTALYEQFPLNFIGLPETRLSQEKLVDTMKMCVGRYIDKQSTPGIALNGAVLLAGLASKKLHISDSIDLPDFDAVFDDPDSDAASRAAGFIRAHALSEFAMRSTDTEWPAHFWNRGIELSACEFMEPEDHV